MNGEVHGATKLCAAPFPRARHTTAYTHRFPPDRFTFGALAADVFHVPGAVIECETSPQALPQDMICGEISRSPGDLNVVLS